MSSVNVDPQLRKRLKKLAALKDTTQSAIIREALDLLEEKLQRDKNIKSKHPSTQFLENYVTKIDLEDWELDIMSKVSKDGIDIDDLRMEFNEFE